MRAKNCLGLHKFQFATIMRFKGLHLYPSVNFRFFENLKFMHE